jgi:CBS domain-containing protein
MRVKDLMATSVTCVKPETSIEQVARQMKQENIGSVPVCNDRGEALGIITDRDIVIRSVSNDNQPKTAKEIMTKNLVSGGSQHGHPSGCSVNGEIPG